MGASSSMRNIPLPFFQQNGQPPKILVLGCMKAGKSTLLHQLVKQNRNIAVKNCYYCHTVQYNLLTVYREIKKACDEFMIDYTKLEEDFNTIFEFRHREDLSDKVTASLRAISRSGLFEELQKKRRVLPLPINYNYFVQHSDRMLNKGYIPTELDILLSYSETIGVNTEIIRIGLSRFEVTELPGHHIWRRHWPDFFANTSVVVFVVDLSELCDQDFYTGHLKDKTVGIYKELVENPLFKNTGFLLLFNKNDAFEEHGAGFDFRKLAQHLRTAPEALSFYRSQFSSNSPKNRTYNHIVSLIKPVNFSATVYDSLNRIFKKQKERAQLE